MTPLIAHVVHRFGVGGLENGLVNLVNHIPADHYRHVIISLTTTSAFAKRITRDDVHVIPLDKPEGHDWRIHARLWKMLRALKPAIVHTRNLPTLEFQVTARMAGVRARIHGEHGRDMYDLDGSNRKYNALRRIVRPFVNHYITVSRDLERWLTERLRVPADRVTHVCNGVDLAAFAPRRGTRTAVLPAKFATDRTIVFGTIGRLEHVKDQPTLARAFVALLEAHPAARDVARLVIVGDGTLRAECESILRDGGAWDLAWLPGERADVADCLKALDVFVLPSIAEGISNTILEAMATGLPVIATAVGGNPELVADGATGTLVPRGDPAAMAAAMRRYLDDRASVARQGAEGRRTAEARYSLDGMVRGYLDVYDRVLAATAPLHARPARS